MDNLTWRHLYWMSLPLLVLCLVTVPIGVPSIRSASKGKADVHACALVALASSTTIIGLSFAGDRYPWTSPQVLGLLGISLLSWVLFFRVETRTEEPILDPVVLRNRSFLTVSLAALLCLLGQMGFLMYFPMFLQGVRGISATQSGQIITPYAVLMAFVGVPVGFLLVRSRRYKCMCILGYALLTVVMFGIALFDARTPVMWSVAASTLAGLGPGAIPTVNTLVVQNMASLGNSRVLLSPSAMASLEERLTRAGSGKRCFRRRLLFQKAVEAIRTSMEAGLRNVFWVGAIAMLLAFLLISTVPELSVGTDVLDDKHRDPVAPSAPAAAD